MIPPINLHPTIHKTEKGSVLLGFLRRRALKEVPFDSDPFS